MKRAIASRLARRDLLMPIHQRSVDIRNQQVSLENILHELHYPLSSVPADLLQKGRKISGKRTFKFQPASVPRMHKTDMLRVQALSVQLAG